MGFKAIVVNKAEDIVTQSVKQLEDKQLPADGDVTIAIEYSSLNYKDGLCLTGNGGLVRDYPHIPGIDFAGTVESSSDERFQAGDKVVLTGWRVGEVWWGGFSQKAKVKGDWLVHLPKSLDAQQAMAIGTAGFAAMLAIDKLEQNGLKPDQGEVLVTGAAGGVGSIATAILANLGYSVAAVTGREDTSAYLKSLGATRIVARSDLNEPSKRPLESETWAGCIDAVGGVMLARVLTQTKYGGAVAAVGLAGGAGLQTTVIPFLLRGVNLLGIDSVLLPTEQRLSIWQRLATDLPLEKLMKTVEIVGLESVVNLGKDILKGNVKGRIVVDVNA
jgi:acrylyl-CoA reductase (NADPH)